MIWLDQVETDDGTRHMLSGIRQSLSSARRLEGSIESGDKLISEAQEIAEDNSQESFDT